MNTPQAVKDIRARRERRQAWDRLMEAMQEDWRPGAIYAYNPELHRPHVFAPPVMAPMLTEKWWKV